MANLPVRPDPRMNYWNDTFAARTYEKVSYETIATTTSLPRIHHQSAIEFRYFASATDFLDLSNLNLRLHATLLDATGQPVKENYSVSIINYPLLTIWQNVEIYLNQRLVR